MKHILKKIFPWMFEDWDRVVAEKENKLNAVFYDEVIKIIKYRDEKK